MHKSKFLALLLAVAMVVSMVVVPVYAAEGELGLVLTPSSATAAPGGTVDVTLSLDTNPNFCGLTVKVDYPDGWTITNVAQSYSEHLSTTDGGAVSAVGGQAPYKDPYTITYLHGGGTGDVTGTGPLTTFTFAIPEGATGAGAFSATVTEAYNVLDDDVPVATIAPIEVTVQAAGSASTDCPEHGAVDTWTEVAEGAWNSGITLTEGHYKLMGNQTLSAKNTPIVVDADTKVCIDLNGYNITQTAAIETASTSSGSKFARVFENSGELTILDSTAKTEAGVYTSGVISGGWVTAAAGKNNDAGGNIYNASGATFNLHSGTVSGGRVRKHGIGETLTATGGGNIFGTGAEINIYGGLVKDGQAYTNYTNTGATANRTGTVVGGNISVSGGTLNIEGGTISGGKADNQMQWSNTQGKFAALGGNIFITGATVSISGGIIENGVAYIATVGADGNATGQTSTARGGNIYIAGAANVTIGENAIIRGGSTSASTTAATDKTLSTITNYSNGGNIYTSSSETVTIDGTISGGSAQDGASIYVYSGDVILDAALSTGTATRYGGGVYLNGGELTVNGKITECTSENRGAGIYQANGTLNLYGEISGCTSTKRGGGINALNSSVVNIYGGAEISGNTDTEKYGSAVTITGKSAYLNVYGGLLSNSQSGAVTVYSLYSNINLYNGTIENTVDNGTAIGQYYSSSHDKPTVTMYGGHVAGRLRALVNSIVNIYGGTVDEIYDASTEAKIYNGVVGNECTDYLADCACYFEGHVWNYKHIAGTCTAECPYEAVLAADATDNNYAIVQQTGEHTAAADAENLETGYSCQFCGTSVAAPADIKEGTCSHGDHGSVTWLVWDGVATNGHYYVEESFTIDTGMIEIADGEELCLDLNGKTVTAQEGAARMFEVKSGGTLNLMDSGTNGTLQGVTTTGSGAVIRSNGVFNLYSGTIQGGTVSVDSTSGTYAGNVYIGSGEFNMSGGTIKDGSAINANASATVAGGNLYITGGAEATISGGTISGGTAEHGGNIACNTGAQITISGDVEITGGTASGYGDNIWVRGEKNDVDTLLVIGSGVNIGAGTTEAIDVQQTSGTGKIEIQAGVTLYSDPTEYLSNCVALHDASEGKYVTYAQLAGALTASGEGDTVTLGMNVADAGEIALKAGVTLDLNGKTLEADSIDAATNTGAHIVDNDGTGKLAVDNFDYAGFAKENNMLPVAVDGGYAFETPVLKQGYYGGTTKDDATQKIAFYIANEEAKTAMKAAAEREGEEALKIGFFVTYAGNETGTYYWLEKDTPAYEAYLASWDTRMIVITLTGCDTVTDLEVKGCVQSGEVVVYYEVSE